MSEALIVYFSSVTNNTEAMVNKLGFPSRRIPLYTYEDTILVDQEYVLFVPTYGGGAHKTAVPKQVIKFLNVEQNRKNCIGVVTSGNKNFGQAYGLAGEVISKKLGVPILYRFEIRGFEKDVETLSKGIEEYFKNPVLRDRAMREIEKDL